MPSVDEEIAQLVVEITRLGQKNKQGQVSVAYGVLFKDDRCQQVFEALLGTLKAAKKRKVITFEGELLLQGVHDHVEIVLL
ncbi:hypothetical protein HDV03_001010 [Kappamyces sp. JEL0829]|nr:hypothetical protein HDV03_001010 [Kappamyces sp. JEL0829]KAJ3336385.1 hypothetical protein HDU91_001801 [Kappamyces sp. JEL0680]